MLGIECKSKKVSIYNVLRRIDAGRVDREDRGKRTVQAWNTEIVKRFFRIYPKKRMKPDRLDYLDL